MIAHLIESGKFDADDIKRAEKTLREYAKKERPE